MSNPDKQSVDNNTDEAATYAKVTWRLIPILFLCYVASYLDRVNVGFAKLQMLSDLNLSEAVYGFAAGIFFLGYFLFEIPSNVILHRVGARLWLARIMITWGLVSGLMVFVQSATTFYIMRFLLGVAEAGFFPGVILYITYWYPSQRRGKIIALFMTAVAVSGIIGGPLSGWIMHTMPGIYGLAGWQWLFIIEAIPSIILGATLIFYLHDNIADADWLREDEKKLLAINILADATTKNDMNFIQVITHPQIWQMAFIYFSFVMGLYGVGFWLPTLIHNTGITNTLTIGLLTAIPYAGAAIGMILTGHSSDKHNERRWHVVIPALLGSVGLLLSTIYGDNTALALAALTLANVGILTTFPLFWNLPTSFVGGAAAAAGIALINSFGNLAGFLSPYLVGWLKDQTQSTNSGMILLAASLIVGAALTLMLPRQRVNK